MHVGVVRSTYKKSDLNQVIKEYKESALPTLASHQGNRSGMLLVDQDSGEAIIRCLPIHSALTSRP